MTGHDDAAQVVLALTNRLVDVGVAPLRASELWPLLVSIDDPTRLLGRPAADLTADLGIEAHQADRIARLLDSGLALAVRLDSLHERGIWTLTPFDAAYPALLRDRLGSGAPPVLYGAGDAALLQALGVGIVGSRETSAAGLDVARAAAAVAVGAGRPVVSGAAGGVDPAALRAAHDAGGSALGVVAGGLELAISRADDRRALLAGRLCLATPYPPDARVTDANATGRSRIIYALSRVTLVVACEDGTGRTWAGATEALDQGHGPVAVWRGAGEGPGNASLEPRGARPVADLADLLPPETP